jgi:AraC family transcriptional regulator, transcriptional activator of pobA
MNDSILPFEIHSIEWLGRNNAISDRPHRQAYFEIILVTKGEGQYCIDLEKYALSENVVYCIPPGRMHQFKCGEGTCGWVVSFSVDFFYLSKDSLGRSFYRDVLAQFSYTGMIKKIDELQERDIQHLVHCMAKEFDGCLPSREEVLSGLLKVFLIQLRRLPDSIGRVQEEEGHVELVNVFCSRLEQYFLTKRTVSEYATDLLVSAQYLDLTVTRITGFPADYHIRQRVVLEAKRLAIFSRDTMREIAGRLGFQDLSYFSRFFKQEAGVNFSEFRHKYAG